MAQPAAPTPPAEGLSRPLPRGGRLSQKNTRPRFQPIDAAWMIGLGVLFAVLSAWARGLHGGQWPSVLVGAATVMAAYLLGWRASGRVAGIIGGLLSATSAAFIAACSADLNMALFALLTVASLFAFVAGSSLAALGLAALAASFRADGILLGLLLLALTVAQRRQRAWLGALLFVVLTAGALFLPKHAQGIHSIAFGMNGSLWRLLIGPSVGFLLWFLLPFCGEMADPIRRARWLPVVLWTLLSLAVGTAVLTSVFPLLPLLFVLMGGGLARLMPALGGDFPAPATRYVLATLAVLSLIGLRARQEWPLQRAAPTPTSVQAAIPRIPVVPTTPKPPAITRHTAPAKRQLPATAPHAQAAPPAKPTVPLYHIVNGRSVKRSTWAIQWDKTHLRP